MAPPCKLWTDDMRRTRTTKQPHFLAIVQALHFSMFGHIAWIPTKQVPWIS